MVDYDCGFTINCYYLGFCPITKWYVHNSCNMGTCDLPDTPSALGPAAFVLLVLISGKPLMPMLQLYNVQHIKWQNTCTACMYFYMRRYSTYVCIFLSDDYNRIHVQFLVIS